MIYICIPVYNEAPTIGLLLWRIRKVLQEFPREYEVLVYDDGSSDATAETLKPYAETLPLTVLGGSERVGYGRAIDQLCRAASARTRYPRRDAVIVMQGDFTDQPEHLPELVKRFEGGVDLVVAERPVQPSAPSPVRLLQRLAPWAVRPFVRIEGVSDPFGTFRLFRISLLRDLLKESGDEPVVQGQDVWAANLELLLRLAKLARRTEAVTLEPRYDVRPRESRVHPWTDAINLFRFGRAAQARRAGASR